MEPRYICLITCACIIVVSVTAIVTRYLISQKKHVDIVEKQVEEIKELTEESKKESEVKDETK